MKNRMYATCLNEFVRSAVWKTKLPVFLVDLEVVGAVANGRVEGKGLVQVARFGGTKAVQRQKREQLTHEEESP